MKKIISRMKPYVWAVTLACPLVLSGGDLSMYCMGAPCSSPAKGEEWDSGMLPLVARQVLTKGGGALVCVDSSYIRDAQGTPRLVFVKMPVLGLVDGASLPKTIYRCIGTFSYFNTLGAEAVIPAFEKLSQVELLKIQKAEEERGKAAEKAAEMWARKTEDIFKIVSEKLKEFELADQSEREAFAKGLLADKKFGIANRILIESCVAGSLVCKEKDYRVGRLEKFKTESKWLDILNLICEMHNSNERRLKSFFSQLPTGEMQRRIKDFVDNSIAEAKKEIVTVTGVAIEGKEIDVGRKVEEWILISWRSGLESVGRFEKYPDMEQIQYVVSSLSKLEVFAEIGVAEGCRIQDGLDHRLEIYRQVLGWDRMPEGGRRMVMHGNVGFTRIPSQEWEFRAVWKNGERNTDDISNGHPSVVEYALGDTNTICMIACSKTHWDLDAIGAKIRGCIKQVEDHEIPPEDGEVAFRNACIEAKKFITDNFVKFGDRGSRHSTKMVPALSSGTTVGKIPAAEVKKDKDLLAKAMAGISVPTSSKGNPKVRKIVKMMRDQTIAKIYAKYTGKSCEDEITAFKSEWESVSAAPNVQSDATNDDYKEKEREINTRIAELKELCHTWAVRKRGLARTPQVVRDAEKEIKDLQGQLSKLKIAQDRSRIQAQKAANREIEEKRDVILKKYHDRITKDLVAIMDEFNQ